MGAALGFRLEIREDSSMKPSQGVTTNLERKKKKKRLFVPKRRAGIHQTLIWKSDYSHRGLCSESQLFLLEQNNPCPLLQGAMSAHGKKSILGSSLLCRHASSPGS